MTSARGWTRIVAAIASLAVAAVVRADDVTVNPGQVNLSIRFENSASEVLDYLDAHPVVELPWSPNELPVRLTKPGAAMPASAAVYAPGTVPPEPSATATLLADVSAEGTNFRAVVDSLVLHGDATYRFGALSAFSPALTTCGPVLPLTDVPGGFDCEVSECAALLNLNITLVGADMDLGALDESLQATCHVEALVEEVPFSGNFVGQAELSASVGVDALKEGHVVLPILVRGDGSRFLVRVRCNAPLRDGQTGFVLVPGTQTTPLERTTFPVPTCDAVEDLDIPLLVERTAGILSGLFDISGRTETATGVWFRHGNARYSVEPPIVPAGETPDPNDPWIFEGAPPAAAPWGHDVGARALVDGGLRYLELPHRRNLNGSVEVNTGSYTDLGSTFVALPHALTGSIVITDRKMGLGVDRLRTEPISYLWSSWAGTSYIGAVGRPELVLGGKSGDGGLSRSVLQGTYDPDAGESRLTYELLLAGLSDEDAALDGTGSAPTPWLVKDLLLEFGTPSGDNWQRLDLEIPILLPRTTLPIPDSGVAQPLESLPELHMCVGQVSLTVRTDPTVAQLYDPRAHVRASEAILTIPGDPHSLIAVRSAMVTGAPRNIGNRTDEVELSMLLPAGAQYGVWPSVRISSPSGENPTILYLGLMNLPVGNILQCGQGGGPCIYTTPDGESSRLTIGVEPPVPDCHETGILDFDVVIESDRPVEFLTLTIDDGTPEVLCSPCTLPDGTTPAVPVSVTIPADGEIHTLTLEAGDQVCSVKQQFPVLVPAQDLTLLCPGDFTCVVPESEIPLAADHPCIVEHLSWPDVVGGCEYPTEIFDDRPETFPLGDTEVHFTASPGGATCTTTVTVEKAPTYQLGYADPSGLKVRAIGSGLYQMIVDIDDPVAWLEFDAKGQQLAAAIASPYRAVEVYDVEERSLLYQIQEHMGAVNLQFHPGRSSHLAVVLGAPTAPLKYWIAWYINGSRQEIRRIPREDYMSLPEIAWDRHGERLLGIVASPEIGSSGIPMTGYHVRLYDWSIATTGLVNPTDVILPRSGPREEPFELIYGSTQGAGVFTSHRGVSRADSASALFLSEIPNGHMDITADLSLAAFVGEVWQQQVKLYVLRNPGFGSGLDVDPGRVISLDVGYKPRVAISDDGARIAVSLGDRIDVFEYPGFDLVETFKAFKVRHMRFRPLATNAGPP
jgi:hypothetical protein